MGEKENNNNQNESPVIRLLRNAILSATMADLPAMMTASGWRKDEKGDYVLDLQNDPHVILLRDNLAAEGTGVMLGEFGLPALYGLYNLGLRGLGKAGSNYARAKLISREMQNVATPNHTYPLNVGWGPKQTIKVTHATDSLKPLQLFFDKRYDVTHEGANPFGVWYLGKWGLPRTTATNSLPGKAEKAERARKIFADRKYKHEGEVTLDKPLTTVGEVPNRRVLSYDAEKMGADGIIYNNVYDNGYDNNQVILSYKLHVPSNKKGSKIHIKKKNRGKFTEYCGGEVTNECIQKAKKSKNPKLRKRATFALNSRRWKHEEGAKIHKPDGHKSILDNGWMKDRKVAKGSGGTFPGFWNENMMYSPEIAEDNPVVEEINKRNYVGEVKKLPYAKTILFIRNLENPREKGIKNGVARAYDSRTAGYGTDFVSGHPELASKIKSGKWTALEAKDLAVIDMRNHDRVIMENLLQYTTRPDTISPGPRLLAALARYHYGNIRRNFDEWGRAIANGDAETQKKIALKLSKGYDDRNLKILEFDIYGL